MSKGDGYGMSYIYIKTIGGSRCSKHDSSAGKFPLVGETTQSDAYYKKLQRLNKSRIANGLAPVSRICEAGTAAYCRKHCIHSYKNKKCAFGGECRGQCKYFRFK